MKKMKLTKSVGILLAVASVLVSNPIGVSAEWKQDSNGLWNSEGNSWSIGWKEIDGKWYYFGQDGYMVHDTNIDGYNIGSDGSWIENTQIDPPQTSGDYQRGSDSFNSGWKLINGKYYFFNDEGGMQKNTIVDEYYLDENGAWDPSKGRAKLQDITIQTEKRVYELGTEEIKAYITNNTNLEIGYGPMYEVEKFENNKWQRLEFEKFEADDAIIIIPPQKTCSETYELRILQNFKNLTSGKYRIVKEVGNLIGTVNLTAEFELK
jgi:hypothetical protein